MSSPYYATLLSIWKVRRNLMKITTEEQLTCLTWNRYTQLFTRNAKRLTERIINLIAIMFSFSVVLLFPTFWKSSSFLLSVSVVVLRLFSPALYERPFFSLEASPFAFVVSPCLQCTVASWAWKPVKGKEGGIFKLSWQFGKPLNSRTKIYLSNRHS